MTLPLAPELQRDSVPLFSTAAAAFRVSRDTRWPWLILVPTGAEVSELHELDTECRRHFLDDVARASATLQKITGCASVNIGMLGNIVTSLHCHVIARSPGDPGWPGPVWGHGKPAWRSDEHLPAFATRFRSQFPPS